MLISLIAIALVFEFMNGMRDAGNFVSAMVSTHAISLRWALLLTSLAELCGPFLIGTKVAYTFSRGLIVPSQIHISVLLAALISASIWNIITLFIRIPSSSSHAFLGGLIGAVYAGADLNALQITGVIKILIGLVVSPLLGFVVSFLFTKIVFLLSLRATPSINKYFRFSQIITGITLAISYGANDAQKSIGIISLALLVTGNLTSFSIPLWVIFISAGSTALGIGLGGWSMIKTLGHKFFNLRPIHGFASQLSSVAVILTASLFGAPMSSSQVVTSSILGTGTADRKNMVRWKTANDIFGSWLITIPVSFFLGILSYGFLSFLNLTH